MQLSWNYNYAPAGVRLREDLKNPTLDLLANPEQVTEDPVLAFSTAIYFWMTAKDIKPSCHDVMIGTWTPSEADNAAKRLPGYGTITNIINGAQECGKPGDTREEDRVQFYMRYANEMGIATGDNMYCDTQQPWTSS